MKRLAFNGLMIVWLSASIAYGDNFGLGESKDEFLLGGILGQQVCTDLNRDGICDQTGVSLYRTQTTVRRPLSKTTVTRDFGLNRAVVMPQFGLTPAASERVISQTIERTTWVPKTEIVERAVVTPPKVIPATVPLCAYCGKVHVRRTRRSVEIHHGMKNHEGEIMYGSNEVNRALRFRPLLRRRLARMGGW